MKYVIIIIVIKIMSSCRTRSELAAVTRELAAVPDAPHLGAAVMRVLEARLQPKPVAAGVATAVPEVRVVLAHVIRQNVPEPRESKPKPRDEHRACHRGRGEDGKRPLSMDTK